MSLNTGMGKDKSGRLVLFNKNSDDRLLTISYHKFIIMIEYF